MAVSRKSSLVAQSSWDGCSSNSTHSTSFGSSSPNPAVPPFFPSSGHSSDCPPILNNLHLLPPLPLKHFSTLQLLPTSPQPRLSLRSSSSLANSLPQAPSNLLPFGGQGYLSNTHVHVIPLTRTLPGMRRYASECRF